MADVQSRSTQKGADTFIDFGGGNTLTLSSVNKGVLTAADFVLQIDTVAPAVSSITAVTDNGLEEINAGHVVTITVGTSEVVNVPGTPTLQLNDNEVATYIGGTGSNALTFAYTVKQGDTASDLQVTGLKSGKWRTVQDGAANNLVDPVAQDLALQIETTITQL